MAKITFKGNPIVETVGDLPSVGSKAPDFKLIDGGLAEVTLANYAGKKVVLNIFPSVDTPVCATSVRRFNQEAGNRENTVVVCISADLPFAHSRFCGVEGLDKVVCLSNFRDRQSDQSKEFGQAYGTLMTTGPLAGLLARSVVVLDQSGNITHTELVPEVVQEPNYDQALAALS